MLILFFMERPCHWLYVWMSWGVQVLMPMGSCTLLLSCMAETEMQWRLRGQRREHRQTEDSGTAVRFCDTCQKSVSTLKQSETTAGKTHQYVERIFASPTMRSRKNESAYFNDIGEALGIAMCSAEKADVHFLGSQSHVYCHALSPCARSSRRTLSEL